MKLKYALLFPFFIYGCIGPAGGPDTSVNPGAAWIADQTMDESCFGQTIEQCEARTDCTLISGWTPMRGESGYCVDFSNHPAPVSCRPVSQECGEAITVAAPAHQPDRCIWFPTTCVPEGWRECNVGDVPECPSP
jgi:hypothetical protein